MNVDKTIASIPSMNSEKRKDLRDNALKRLGDPEMSEAAQQVLSALGEAEGRAALKLSEHVGSLPVAKRVAEAFTVHPLTAAERKTVQVLLDNPGQTSFGLSELASWGGQIWHEKFGTMCKKRESRLWPAPPSDVRDANFYSGILAEFSEQTRTWTMKPEAIAGFALIGLKPSRR